MIEVGDDAERALALSAAARHREFHRRIEERAAALQALRSKPAQVIAARPCELRPKLIALPLPTAPRIEPIDRPYRPWFFIVDEDNAPRLTIAEIKATVADHFGITVLDLESQRRTLDVVRPRQIVVYLARRLTPKSLPEIARRLGNRDHTTALSADRKIGLLLVTNAEIAHDVAVLFEKLTGVQQ